MDDSRNRPLHEFCYGNSVDEEILLSELLELDDPLLDYEILDVEDTYSRNNPLHESSYNNSVDEELLDYEILDVEDTCSRNNPLNESSYSNSVDEELLDHEAYPILNNEESIKERRIHEVFLSFRGEDTRASFVSHLYASLQNAGINVFKDDESLPRGDHISDSLLRAIEQSEISVVVFSRNYAGSGWCLDELNKIMECRRTIGQVVLPVFYDVDPSEVRHQKGEFGKAFRNLEHRTLKEDEDKLLQLKKMLMQLEETEGENLLNTAVWGEDKVLGWREALRQAAGIAGIVVLNSRNESEDIENIVETVIRHLDKTVVCC